MRSSDIQGWCDFEWLYNRFAQKYSYGDIVEVGVWKGRSITYLAEQLQKYNHSTKLYAVDTWAGSNEKEHQDYINSIGGPDELYHEFIRNIRETQTDNLILPLRGKSLDIVKILPNNYFDVVFIDASHEYEDFKLDLLAWVDKVKVGGEFWGHDAEHPPIQQVLNEIYPNQWTRHGSCWEAHL